MAAHRRFVDPVTGRIASRFAELRSCPVCESACWRELFDKQGGTYVKCDECSMVYLNPVLTDDALTDLYSRNHDVQAAIVESDPVFYRRIYGLGLDLLDRYLPCHDAILDFGCSSGFFLDRARERGWASTTGVELNRLEAEQARRRGHRVHGEGVTRLSGEYHFDAVTLWDVFEHLKDGRRFLEQCRRLLAHGGVVFLQVPNAMSLAARLMQSQCNMFDGMEHCNLYGPETLRRLAERAGYEVVAMTSVISELAVLNNYVHYESPYSGRMGSTSELLGIIDERTLHERLLGYKLQALLRPA